MRGCSAFYRPRSSEPRTVYLKIQSRDGRFRGHNNTAPTPAARKARTASGECGVMHAITRINELWTYLWLYQPLPSSPLFIPHTSILFYPPPPPPPPPSFFLFSFFFFFFPFVRSRDRIPNRTANATITWSYSRIARGSRRATLILSRSRDLFLIPGKGKSLAKSVDLSSRLEIRTLLFALLFRTKVYSCLWNFTDNFSK